MLNILTIFFIRHIRLFYEAVVKKMMKFPFKDTILLHMKSLKPDMRGVACTEDGKLDIIYLLFIVAFLF